MPLAVAILCLTLNKFLWAIFFFFLINSHLFSQNSFCLRLLLNKLSRLASTIFLRDSYSCLGEDLIWFQKLTLLMLSCTISSLWTSFSKYDSLSNLINLSSLLMLCSSLANTFFVFIVLSFAFSNLFLGISKPSSSANLANIFTEAPSWEYKER